MTEYDPLAKAIEEAYGDVDVAFDSDIPEWKLADWQAAAKVAREFIAAEDDGWVEVSCIDEIKRGDEVLVTEVEGDRKIVTTGVAHDIGARSIHTRDGYYLVGYLFSEYESVRVRRTKQEPPTAPFIIAYKLEGRDEYPNGIPMVRIPEGTYEGMYSSPEHITTILWSPSYIHRYELAKAVVDG